MIGLGAFSLAAEAIARTEARAAAAQNIAEKAAVEAAEATTRAAVGVYVSAS